MLGSTYGLKKECTGLVEDLVIEFEAGKYSVKEGERKRKVCYDGTWESKTDLVNSILEDEEKRMEEGDEGGLLQWCGQWQGLKSSDDKERRKNRFIADCNMYLFGDVGEEEENRAGAELVRSFLQALADMRHQGGGDNRFKEFKDAFKSINIDSLDASAATYDEPLQVLAKAWAVVEWDWSLRQKLELAAENIATAVDASGYNHLSDINGKTGRAFIIEFLTDPDNQQDINRKLCDGDHEYDFTPFLEETWFTTFTDKITEQPKWEEQKPVTFNSEDAETDVLAFINNLIDSGKLGLCEETHFSDVKNCFGENAHQCFGNEFNNAGPALTWITHMYWPISEALLFKSIKDIGAALSDPDGDGNGTLKADGTPNDSYNDAEEDFAALKEKVTALADKFEHYKWMKEELGRMENRSHGADSKLFELTQWISDDIARQSYRHDKTYKPVLRKIMAKSTCPFDASISHDPLWDGEKTSFPVIVRSPVRRKVAGDVTTSLKLDEDDTGTKFQVEDARVNMERDGQCYWGNIQRLNHLTITETTFKGSYSEGWVDTCREDDSGSSDEDEDDEGPMHHEAFNAKIKADD